MNTLIYALTLGLIIGVTLCVYDRKNIRAYRKPWLIRLFAFAYGFALSAFFAGGTHVVALAPSPALGILGWFVLILSTFAIALLAAGFGFALIDFPARAAHRATA